MTDPIACCACVWSAVEAAAGHRVPITTETVTVLACRRRAPSWQGFPWVAPMNWCGDFYRRASLEPEVTQDGG